jgi:hypothetical protein
MSTPDLRDRSTHTQDVPRLFHALGDRIEAAYRAAGYDESAFPAIAAAALAERPPAAELDADAVLRWALLAPELPRQADVDGPFGQPAIQVYSTPRWYIEVLHWLDGTTAIHQHSFAGAFHVLAGSSIHARYAFAEDRRYGARLRLGRLTQTDVEWLQRGAIQPIHSGAALIHSLFHLDRPSVTVVVRTTHVADAFPQLSYAAPGLAFDPFHRTEQLARRLQICDALARLDHPDLADLLARAYADPDPFASTQLILQTAARLRPDALPAALADARAVHGPLAEVALAAALEQRRQDAIVGLRGRLRSPDHRFLLALLLYFDRAAPILEFVRQRWPERDPADEALRLIAEIADLPDPTRPGRRIFEFDLRGPGGAAARAMIGGRGLAEVAADLRDRFDPALVDRQLGDLAALQRALRDALVGPLFRA